MPNTVMNVLLITLDQFRGDCLGAAGHPVVRTPNLDRLAERGTRFARHYSQAAPCAPGRASLYTGTYQMNHRVVANGTPLDARLDNLALMARRAGYRPALFGYTDQAIDPRMVTDRADPRLNHWEGVLPGFDPVLDLIGDQLPWRRWLVNLGHRVDIESVNGAAAERAGLEALASEPERPAEHSHSAFMTDTFLGWVQAQPASGWFAHLSYLRPHPPYAAAGHFAEMYHPGDVGDPIAATEQRHPLHEALCTLDSTRPPSDPAEMRRLRAQYYGMVSEVDHQLGRVFDHLERARLLDRTLIVVTADHGEQLGDHGYVEKAGFFEQSYHVPAIISAPDRHGGQGLVIEDFTENVDVMPTLCELLGREVPLQCDGLPLTPFLDGRRPPDDHWREAAHWEFDWRFTLLGTNDSTWPWDRRPERQQLAVSRSDTAAYVHFGNGDSLCFDLATDPTWRTPLIDPAKVLEQAQAMLTWRSVHADRTLAGTLVGWADDGSLIGRDPLWGLGPR